MDNADRKCTLLGKTVENLDVFFESSIYDGVFYWIELAEVDFDSMTITYSCMYWWDYMEKEDIVVEIAVTARKILDIFNSYDH